MLRQSQFLADFGIACAIAVLQTVPWLAVDRSLIGGLNDCTHNGTRSYACVIPNDGCLQSWTRCFTPNFADLIIRCHDQQGDQTCTLSTCGDDRYDAYVEPGPCNFIPGGPGGGS